VKILESVKTEARSNFAAQHLAAAEFFHSQLQAVERSHPPDGTSSPPPEYLHFWFAAVAFSAMALEANAHDLLTAAERGEATPAGHRRFRTEDLRRPLMDRYGLLYQAACGGAKFSQQSGVAQEARALVILRDEVVHFKTEFRSNPTSSRKLEALLRARITLNPYKCGDVFFPEQCVSSSSSAWATRVSREFMRYFAAQTGYRPNV
jgi:hypothetical protein